ncbi:MAG: penicillin-binding protein, partial [Propionibacteriaceae bacterium]|nr:penicillin-binding protein [Propionibacteriaceae bacterium]
MSDDDAPRTGHARRAQSSSEGAGATHPSAGPSQTAHLSKGKGTRQGSGGSKRKKKLTRGQKVGRFFLWAGITVLSLILIAIILAVIYYQRVHLPDPNAAFTTSTTTLYYRDGTTELGTLAIQNREPLATNEIPDDVKNCVLAAEDRTFYTNPGISIPGMIRASLRVAAGGDLQSGSTLTQQYIKVLYLSDEQTMGRKAKEMVLAIKMTNQMPKDQILTDYLNTVFYGRGAYGIQAAAKAYFNVDAKDLSLQQAAVLAAVVNSPSQFDPSNPANVPALTDRYNYVLDGLVAMGKLTPQAESVIKGTLPTFPTIAPSDQYKGSVGFLVDAAKNELIASGMSQAQVEGGGLKIVTTFDAALQKQMDATGNKYTQLIAASADPPQDPSDLHLGMASVQVGTGEVLAMYNGPNYIASSYPWAERLAAGPTGSTFKPYAFIAGERNGFSLKSMLDGNTFSPKDGGGTVSNAGHTNYGQVSLLKATEESINTAYVNLTEQLPNGWKDVAQAAKDAGVPASTAFVPSSRIPLGDTPVSAVDQAGAYATFANNGARATTHFVKQVTNPSGNVIYQGDTSTQQTIEAPIAQDLNYALQSVVDSGTATAAKSIGVPTAGKTGTVLASNNMTAASWFVGYTTSIVTAVDYRAGLGMDPLEPFGPGTSHEFV